MKFDICVYYVVGKNKVIFFTFFCFSAHTISSFQIMFYVFLEAALINKIEVEFEGWHFIIGYRIFYSNMRQEIWFQAKDWYFILFQHKRQKPQYLQCII